MTPDTAPEIQMDAEQTIRDVAREWTNGRKLFTAYDVSQEVQKRGVKERHRHLKDRVHAIIYDEGTNQNYTRVLRDVGSGQSAWLYYPLEADPWSYQVSPQDRKMLMLPFIPATPLLPNPSPATIPAGAYGTDNRGRLCLPAGLLRNIGVNAGDVVNVVSKMAEETLFVHKITDKTVAETLYTAEPDGNVRIAQRTLSRANLHFLPCYYIVGDANGIVISSK